MNAIPILCFLLMIGLFSGGWRERFLLASICWGVLVLFLTEGLSLWHGLDAGELAFVWTMVLAGLGVRLWLTKPALPPFPTEFNAPSIILVLLSLGIVMATALIAYTAPPNNWDSMTYHMARVVHWTQDKTMAMYPTANLRQINYPPWSSYAIAQFYILMHNDRWANFIQWFSALGSMIGTSLIAARLKGSPLSQALAALLTATIPMGILQSTSTQNDYTAAFWLVCFVYFGLRLIEDNRWFDSAAGAGALGLAWLVKGTAYVYAIPFLVWMAAAGFKKHGPGAVGRVVALLLAALLMNSTYYVRNFQLAGKIMPPSEESNVVGHAIEPKVVAANFALNLGLQLATVWDYPNRLVEQGVAEVHHWLGIEEGDARVCMAPGTKFQILDYTFRYHEDYAGNFIHTVMIFFCLAASIFLGQRLSPPVRPYAWSLLGAILLFLMTIKWSPFHGRYHLPVYVLFVPFLAVVWQACFKSWGIMIIAIIFSLAALPWVMGNKSRPLTGPRSIMSSPRLEQYFFNNMDYVPLLHPMAIAAKFDCSQIGLNFGGYSWEYPLTAIGRWAKAGNLRFEHILVDNISAKLDYPLGAFDPCLVIRDGQDHPLTLNWQGHVYSRVDQKGSIATYLKVH